MDQVWQVSGREDAVKDQTRLPVQQGATAGGDKIVLVPRTEECTGADDESVGVRVQHSALAFRFGSPIDAQRVHRVALAIRRPLPTVEYEVRGKRDERQVGLTACGRK